MNPSGSSVKMSSTSLCGRNLKPATLEALNLSDAQRKLKVWDLKNTWLPYPRADGLIAYAEELLIRPASDRMPCLLIWAEPNSGKTAFHKHYLSLHPIDPNLEGDAVYAPVIGIEIFSPDEGALYNAILTAIHAPFRILDRAEKKRYQIETLLPRLGTRQLLTDELNTAIAGSLLKQRRFLVALKHLANKLKLSIIATGTQDAKIALAPDSQLTSRFAMEELYRWVDDREFRKLLESFERRLPLREASELQRPSFAKMIHDLTEGYLGEVAELLMKAAVLAIDTHKEKIDLDIIQKLKWLPPSKRQGAARDK
jgi:hypothetical protein